MKKGTNKRPQLGYNSYAVISEKTTRNASCIVNLAKDDRLIVVEANDVGGLFGQYLRNAEKLAGLVGKLNGEAEDAAAGDKPFVNEGGDRRDVDIAAGNDGRRLFAAELPLGERSQRENARAFGDEFVLFD